MTQSLPLLFEEYGTIRCTLPIQITRVNTSSIMPLVQQFCGVHA
eukprot:CAMPEP_0194573022 /NCGR_PEP_ID=MMETSP0292-20121207/9375_1 /TAXON_ID=39354 /ORGANISM="Heterosigma akashiwo, Strain CCMP2393" /LENGTH=43 /DNA_ID= /DNA_START= /DNA_END= /DNA_ORIENTATION=